MFVVYRTRDDYRDFGDVLLHDTDESIFFNDDDDIDNAIKADIIDIFKEDGDLYKEGKEFNREYNIADVETKEVTTIKASVKITLEDK